MTPKEFREHLRQQLTPAEKISWYALRAKRFANTKFRRQHTIGDYTVDFYNSSSKLIIEVDGFIHYDQYQEQYDMERDLILCEAGYKVLRFDNEAVQESLEAVLVNIENHI